MRACTGPFAAVLLASSLAAQTQDFGKAYSFAERAPATAVVELSRPVAVKLAVGPEAVEIGRQNRLEAGRVDAETGERAAF